MVGEDEEEWVDTEDMEDELEDGEAEDDVRFISIVIASSLCFALCTCSCLMLPC